MTYDYRNNPKWKGVAYYYGTEAQANGRSNMNADDKEDIAFSYGKMDWSEMPEAHRDEAMRLFNQGVQAEREACK